MADQTLDELARSVELLQNQIALLKARVSKLEGQRPPGLVGARAAERAPEPRTEPVIHRRAPTTVPVEDDIFVLEPARRMPAPPQPSEAGAPAREDETTRTARLLARYAEAVADLSGAGEQFIADHRPVAATWSDGHSGYVLGDDPYGAMLWAVPLDGRRYALLPGYKAINNWSQVLAPNRTTTAAEFLGHAFELQPGPGRLTVGAPALATRGSDAGPLAVTRKGRLSGFRT